jgi:pyruvate,water dikinase
VCPTASPSWTILFGIAGALVTDGGGPLAHAAIVAREHSLPAVVGTVNATSRLTDGQLVTIDGTAGTVTIHPAD